MSFTIDVKKELCATQYDQKCCKRAHLAGIAGFCGATVLENGKEAFRMRTESKKIATRVTELLFELLKIEAEVLKAGRIYNIMVMKGADLLLKELGYKENGVVKFSVNPFVVHEECCKTAFLAGAFLGGGYVKTPENGYHFEIKTHYRDLSNDLADIIEAIGFEPKTVMRKSEYVVYLKQSDAICDLLATIGATDAMFELCNVKIYKDMCNNITRKVNCDTANINKTAEAAAQQLLAIKKIQKKQGLSSLPENLETIARLRLENPEATLTELGEWLKPPISKSGVNHRLKKIIQIADSLSD